MPRNKPSTDKCGATMSVHSQKYEVSFLIFTGEFMSELRDIFHNTKILPDRRNMTVKCWKESVRSAKLLYSIISTTLQI